MAELNPETQRILTNADEGWQEYLAEHPTTHEAVMAAVKVEHVGTIMQLLRVIHHDGYVRGVTYATETLKERLGVGA